LIYGWDDTCDTSDNDNKKTTSTMAPSSPRGEEFYLPDNSCTTTGAAVAESLSYDPHRVGSLARLAVAFSPPERALSLGQIEKVDILCVEHDRIDIRAIICEDGGCVSLSVPIVFPQACGSIDDPLMLEGCVVNHIEQLDRSLPELFRTTQDANSRADLLEDNNDDDRQMNFPPWWVTTPPFLQMECRTMRDILNEDDFAPEIGALVRTSLDHDITSSHHRVQMVKVVAVGPAGLWFRVRTTSTAPLQPPPVAATTSASDAVVVVLDVLYPFGGEPVLTVDALRATVLGLVATA
jgi:hypothetical protein